MRAWYSILLTSLFLPAVLWAMPEEAEFGLGPDSIEWKRAEFERWLVRKATDEVKPFIPEEDFRIQANISFKERVKTRKAPTYVNIPLLGTVASMDTGPTAAPERTMFERVARVDLTLIVSDRTDKESVEAAAKIIKQRVPVISEDKIFVDVVKFVRPQMTWSDWLREFKMFVGFLVLMLIFMFTAYLTLSRVRIQTFIRVGPADEQPSSGNSIPVLAPSVAERSSARTAAATSPTAGAAPGAAPSEPISGEGAKFNLPQSLSPAEYRRVQTAASTLTINECIDLIRLDPLIGSLLITVLPTDKSMRVMNQLPLGLQDELTMKTLSWDANSLPQLANELMAAVKQFRSVTKISPEQAPRMQEYIEHVGPENEDVVFTELIRQKKFEELKKAAYHSIPADVVIALPDEILRAAFARFPFADQSKIVACADPRLAERLCPSNDKSMQAHQVREESERIRSIPASLNAAGKIWPKFVGKVREAIQSNGSFQALAAPLVEQWLFEQSGGVVGSELKAKKGRHGAA